MALLLAASGGTAYARTASTLRTVRDFPEFQEMGPYQNLLFSLQRFSCDHPFIQWDDQMLAALEADLVRETRFKALGKIADESDMLPVIAFQSLSSTRVGVQVDQKLSRIRVFKFADASNKIPPLIFGKEVSEISLMTFQPEGCELKSISFLPENSFGVARMHAFYQISPHAFQEKTILNPEVEPVKQAPAKTWITMIDSGVDYNHPDLANHIVRGQMGADPTDGDTLPYDYADCLICGGGDSAYHGTAVAGVMMKGLPSAIKLYTIRVAGDGSALAKLENEIAKAYALGSRLVNLSMDETACEDWEPLRQAVQRFSDMVFVVAAGNFGADIGGPNRVCPASFEFPNLIAVGSIDNQGMISKSSGFSRKLVHLMAKGEKIATLRPGGKTAVRSGTSFSAPAVSRVIAAIQYIRPDLKMDRILQILQSTVIQKSELSDKTVWGGILNPRAAFEKAKAEPYTLP